MATQVNQRKPTIYVIVNKSLGMSAPKLAAQVGHAATQIITARGYRAADWDDYPHRWFVVLEAKNGEQLYHICEYLRERGVEPCRVIDEGVNEIPPFSLTAVGVGIVDKDSETAQYLSDLPSYKHKITGYERNEVWNSAVAHMRAKPWHKRLRNRA